MKKLLVLILFIVGVVSEVSFAKGHDKTVAIGVNPLGLLVGIGIAYVDVAVANKFTIGVEGQVLDDDTTSLFSGIKQEGNAYGARVRYFFNTALDDSWVITGFGGKASSDLTITQTIPTTATDKYEADGTYFGAMIGYHWQWSYIFTHFGLGYMTYNFDMKSVGTPTISTINEAPLDGGGVALDFSLGLSF